MSIKLYSRWPSNLTTCPVTGGCSTRMLEERFRALCAKKQESDGSYCATICRGTILPAELTFIHLSKEIAMPSQNIAPGICSVCGEMKNVKTVRDGKCCSNCSHVYHAVHGNGELLLALLRRVHGDGWLVETLTAIGVAFPIVGAVEYAALREENANLRRERDVLRQAESDTESLVAELRANLEDAAGKNIGVELETSANRDAVLLDLAIGVIEGRVVGIDANTISLLRQ